VESGARDVPLCSGQESQHFLFLPEQLQGHEQMAENHDEEDA
jgi:hypothetical protein